MSELFQQGIIACRFGIENQWYSGLSDEQKAQLQVERYE